MSKVMSKFTELSLCTQWQGSCRAEDGDGSASTGTQVLWSKRK